MKKITLFAFLVALSIGVKSQQTTTDASPKTFAPAAIPAGSRPEGGKVVLPPEKSKPVLITKAATVPVIDGRID